MEYRKKLRRTRFVSAPVVKPLEVLQQEAEQIRGKIKNCRMCENAFVAKPDITGSHRAEYCSDKCRNKAMNLAKKGKNVRMNISDYMRSIARPVYCPELDQSFSSTRDACRILDLPKKHVNYSLIGFRNNHMVGKLNGLTFVDYDHTKHPAPRHEKPWTRHRRKIGI